jgi:hypothetical protein
LIARPWSTGRDFRPHSAAGGLDAAPPRNSSSTGLERASLDHVPPLTKATLMDTFDEAVTDRDLRLADLQADLESERGEQRFGRYRVADRSSDVGRPSCT